HDAVGALTQLIDGEPLPPPVEGAPREDRGLGLQGMLMIALFAAIFLRGVLGRAHALVRVPLGGALIGGLLWLLVSVGAVVGGFVLLPACAGGRPEGGGGRGGCRRLGGGVSGGGCLGGGRFRGGGG